MPVFGLGLGGPSRPCRFRCVLGSILAIQMLLSNAVFGCVTTAEMEFRDILLADLVVVGDVIRYRIVDPDPDPQRGDLRNYAKFDLRIREVLAGPSLASLPPRTRTKPEVQARLYKGQVMPPGRLTVIWDNSTFAEPADLTGNGQYQFLIALRDPSSPLLPMRTGSAFIAPSPEQEHYTVLQAPCSGAFIFEMDSLIAIGLRQYLTTSRDREVEWQVLSDFLFANGAVSLMQREKLKSRQVAP